MGVEEFWQELEFRCGIRREVDDMEIMWCSLPDGTPIQIDRPELLNEQERREYLNYLLKQYGC